MIRTLLFDRFGNVAGILHLISFSATLKLYDCGTFEAKIDRESFKKIEMDSMISIFEDDNCVYSGIVKSKSSTDYAISGYDLRYLGAYALYNCLHGLSPVATSQLVVRPDSIADIWQAVFPEYTLTMSADADISGTLSLDTRAKYVLALTREACVHFGNNVQFLATGSKKILVKVSGNRDRRAETLLIPGITHNIVEELEDRREAYNQIVGLGKGEGEARDWHMIDQCTGYPRCYLYDLREDITHEELVRKTEEKFKELQPSIYTKIKLVPNNVCTYDTDFRLGDTIRIVTRKGEYAHDIVSEISLKLDAQTMQYQYEAVIGTGKNSLTAKIQSLKEGGTT